MNRATMQKIQDEYNLAKKDRQQGIIDEQEFLAIEEKYFDAVYQYCDDQLLIKNA